MMRLRLASFNVQNLRLRRIRNGSSTLDGARDGDSPADQGLDAVALDVADRRLTAQLLASLDADLVALQEVFDQATLDHFETEWLRPLGAPYPARVCLEGNDGGSRDVAVLSRTPLRAIASHAHLTYRDVGLEPPMGRSAAMRIFRRDCLRVQHAALTLYVCHLKAPEPSRAETLLVRAAEAETIARLIIQDHALHQGRWIIAGDFNDHTGQGRDDPALEPLFRLGAEDVLLRLPPEKRWTYYLADRSIATEPDMILIAPTLAPALRQVEIRREGMAQNALAYGGPRFEGVGWHRPHASDHAPVVASFEFS